MAGLNKEIWTDQIMKNFYPDTSFIKYFRNFDDMVEFDKINLADAGVDPDVLINNTTYPIAIVDRTDTPISIELDLFETKNTPVKNAHIAELAYDKLESVIYGHRGSLKTSCGLKAAHAVSPSGDDDFTPVIVTTGEANDVGKKRMTIADILKLKRRFDGFDVDPEKRFLVLDPHHLEDLILEDTKSFKDITDLKNGNPRKFAGFNILQFNAKTYYTAALAKKPFGSILEATDGYCSFAFSGDEVLRADGSLEMYLRENDPEARATIVGFSKRFIGMPIRNKAIGAIVSLNAA